MGDFIYNIFYKLVAVTIRTILRLNGGLTIIGKENVPVDKGVIIAPNHISYLDPLIIGAVIPGCGNFMARKGLFEIPVLRWMIKRPAFPIDRDNPRPSTIKEAVKRLKNGNIVIMFPEGQRSETGELMEAKRGIGTVAVLSKAVVVPTLITGSEKALPVKAKWLKRAKISVVFGKPIYYTSTKDKGGRRDNSSKDNLGNEIMSAIRKLKEDYGNNSS